MFLRQWLFASIALIWTMTAQAEPQIIRLATSEWPPYVSEKLPQSGYITAIIQRAFQKAGYKTSLHFYTWFQATNLAKYQNDAFFPEYQDSKINNIACSIPISGGPIGLYKRKDSMLHYTVANPYNQQDKAFKELSDYWFGVVKGYTNTKVFDSATYLKKREADSDYLNLKQLVENKVDLAMVDVVVADYLRRNNRALFSNTTFMGPALSNKHLHVCFSTQITGYQKKLADFNQALLALQKSGEADQIRDSLSNN